MSITTQNPMFICMYKNKTDDLSLFLTKQGWRGLPSTRSRRVTMNPEHIPGTLVGMGCWCVLRFAYVITPYPVEFLHLGMDLKT